MPARQVAMETGPNYGRNHLDGLAIILDAPGSFGCRIWDSPQALTTNKDRRRVLLTYKIIRRLIMAGILGTVLAGPALANCDDPPHEQAGWDGCDMTGMSFPGADLRNSFASNANFQGADLTGARLNGATLRKTNLAKAKLDGADFTTATLEDSDLSGASLKGANLSDSLLANTNFADADLSNANLEGAILDNANLAGANLAGANFTNASMDQTIWSDGSICATTSFGSCDK
jgi:uncharacterized protein YjbI with pentapeptide repeats